MREYLFRGKRLSDGKWIEGHLTAVFEHTYISKADENGNCFRFLVDPKTVGQYTALRVKGKRWFESDIVSVRDEGEEIYRFVITFDVCGGLQNVKHAVGYMGFYFTPADKGTRRCVEFGCRCDPVYFINEYECKVIGNIHDNPELLEE